MAEIKNLKLVAGTQQEHDSAADEITYVSGQFGNIKSSSNAITSTDAAGDITITPDTTGDLVLDGLKWPQSDGTNAQVIKTNGLGQLSFTDVVATGSWLLAGNSGTTAVTDFLGTTDAVDVSFRSNNIIRNTLKSAGNLQIDFGITKKNQIDADITILTGYTMSHPNLIIGSTATITIESGGDLII